MYVYYANLHVLHGSLYYRYMQRSVQITSRSGEISSNSSCNLVVATLHTADAKWRELSHVYT